MKKPSIFLLGKHCNRTPFSYTPYKLLAQKEFRYADSPFQADFLVLGFAKDINSNRFLIEQITKKNKNAKIVVISEEPLWIRNWSEHRSNEPHEELTDGKSGLRYLQISCLNSKIFSALPIPYFITTSERYIARYVAMLYRNSLLSPQELVANWKRRQFHFAFVGEYRKDTRELISVSSPEGSQLSTYRCDLATKISRDKFIQGFKWHGNEQPRQLVGDWHLNKLGMLHERALFVSSIENTYGSSYVTEKPLDALASLSIPVVWAASDSEIFRFFQPGAVCNVFGKTPVDAANHIDNQSISEDIAAELLNACRHNLETLSRSENIIQTRTRVVRRIAEFLVN